MKPLSDQISRGQSFVHTQKTVRDQFGPATSVKPFRDLSAIIIFFLVAKRSHRSRKLCVTGV